MRFLPSSTPLHLTVGTALQRGFRYMQLKVGRPSGQERNRIYVSDRGWLPIKLFNFCGHWLERNHKSDCQRSPDSHILFFVILPMCFYLIIKNNYFNDVVHESYHCLRFFVLLALAQIINVGIEGWYQVSLNTKKPEGRHTYNETHHDISVTEFTKRHLGIWVKEKTINRGDSERETSGHRRIMLYSSEFYSASRLYYQCVSIESPGYGGITIKLKTGDTPCIRIPVFTKKNWLNFQTKRI